jgi:hypothetical protein
MTHVSTGSRVFRLRWVIVVVLVLMLGAGVYFWRAARSEAGGLVGAHAIPLDAGSRVGSGWFARELTMPRTFAAGRTLSVPEGARVRVVYADGRYEDLRGPVKRELPVEKLRGEAVENFLAVPLAELAALAPGETSSTGGDVDIVSPVGVTRFTNPEVVWEARPETNYDVAIVDPADPMAPPRVTEKVRPPVAFAQLKSPQKRGLLPDRLYEVYVRESDHVPVVGAARILVAKDGAEGGLATEPAELLREAVEAMAKRPTRTGDAWLALSRLPADWRESELAVRLRLRVALELGRVDEFARAREAASRLVKK